MKHEMPEDLQDFWVWQDAYDKGFELGVEEVREENKQVFQQAFIGYIEARYLMLVDLAKKQATLIEDADTLLQIMRELFNLQTADEVEEYLLMLGNDTGKN